MSDNCLYCKQILMPMMSNCPCRSYKVWPVDSTESEGVRIRLASSFMIAAEEYVENHESPKDDESFELMVKNYRGEIKKVIVYAAVTIDLTSEIEEIQEEETA